MRACWIALLAGGALVHGCVASRRVLERSPVRVSELHVAPSDAQGTAVPIVAVFEGKLRAKGEIVRIENAEGAVAGEVEYDPRYPGVKGAVGTGMSLHRADPSAPGGEGAWRAGAPTPGKPSITLPAPGP